MSHHTATHPNSRGLTLLELLLVVLLLSGGIAWLLQSSYLSLKSAQETQQRFFITKGVLEYEVEFLRGTPFDDPALSVGPHLNFTDPPMFTPAFFAPTFPYPPVVLNAVTARQYTVAWADPPANANLKQVTVQVTWIDAFGRRRTNSLSTLISRSGLTNP